MESMMTSPRLQAHGLGGGRSIDIVDFGKITEINPMTTRAKSVPEVEFTHLDKVFFPKGGFTKGQMIRYYLDVAEFILPHLKDRPVTLIRFPDGVAGERFYEKNAPKFAPRWLETFSVPRAHAEGEIDCILVNDVKALAWCANIAAIELHAFLHQVQKLDQPTSVVFDLDPGESADLLTCARVALLVKELLDPLHVEAFPKVSGSKGLQIYVPLNTEVTYRATGAFAKAIAELLEQRHPELVASKMTKLRRRGRVLIDWSQNSPSKTTVSVYSIRGKHDEPFVSMPVTWDELRSSIRTKKSGSLFFHPNEALKRLKKTGDPFAPVLKLRQSLPKAIIAPAASDDPSLARYGGKRDFTRTHVPAPTLTPSSASGMGGRFVIQKHAASHLHYDFRLEMDGTLKSWAVPKGLPMELGVKRSAFAVEDHPLDYLKFEGTIPKGQYGGGTVMVWDIGTYELLGGEYPAGSLKLRLHGKKLRGEWHMFKIRSDWGKDVWLIAKSKQSAKPLPKRQEDSSVLTRRSMAQVSARGSSRPPGARRDRRNAA
jgi:bifunctional non-homologous end joining protein LigD